MMPSEVACPIEGCAKTWDVPVRRPMRVIRLRLRSHLLRVHELSGRANSLAVEQGALPARVPLPHRPRRLGTSAVLSLALVGIMLLTSGPYYTGSAGAVHPGSALPSSLNVTYNSSVDGFGLSFLEWLPTGFQSNATYPLAIFLHGIGSSTAWTRGGVGAAQDLEANPKIVTVAQSDQLILISLNTRSSAGFYQDTPCGGPQRQDVIDAVAAEEVHRHVGLVYLIGFSMGSMGAFSLAATDPGAFTGIATVGTITDAYQVFAENSAVHSVNAAWRSDVCLSSKAKPTSPGLEQLLANLSTPRFDPQAFAGMRIYSVAGARDVRAVNNFSVWPYAQGNSSFVNSSCSSSAFDGEPSNCSATFGSLQSQNPGTYSFRFVWEAFGTHSTVALPAADAYRYLLGLEAGGYFQTTFPPTRLVPA